MQIKWTVRDQEFDEVNIQSSSILFLGAFAVHVLVRPLDHRDGAVAFMGPHHRIIDEFGASQLACIAYIPFSMYIPVNPNESSQLSQSNSSIKIDSVTAISFASVSMAGSKITL